MITQLRIAKVGQETGALLREYLEDRGVRISSKSENVISYGVHVDDDYRCINANVGGGDKIRRMRQMEAGGVRTVPWFAGPNIPDNFTFPALARQIAGHGGLDIVPVFQRQEIPWRIKAGWDWFSSYIPLKTEFRVWCWRGQILDVYEKTMERPEDYAFIGRNFRNGFDFTKTERYPADAADQASKAIHALQFDFGAVDMVYGEDNKIYILEVNTAPGVIKSGAQKTLAKLADKMVCWLKDDCPSRGY